MVAGLGGWGLDTGTPRKPPPCHFPRGPKTRARVPAFLFGYGSRRSGHYGQGTRAKVGTYVHRLTVQPPYQEFYKVQMIAENPSLEWVNARR